jgi:hypothetical protein
MALARQQAEQHYPRYYEPSEVIDFRGGLLVPAKVREFFLKRFTELHSLSQIKYGKLNNIMHIMIGYLNSMAYFWVV